MPELPTTSSRDEIISSPRRRTAPRQPRAVKMQLFPDVLLQGRANHQRAPRFRCPEVQVTVNEFSELYFGLMGRDQS